MSEKGIVKYDDRTGNEVQLSFNIVRNYLVTGKKELVTDQEIMFFMGICKARGLNPFAKDCYLIKYTPNEAAAIIVSVDYFRSRARCQDDYQGYASGVIVQKPDGELRYSNGIVLDGEKLIGGWFEATPKGWLHPFKLEVNLAGYIKKKADGGITKFWSPENQPTMIAKVAESQGFRKCWPNEFQGVYSAEEVNSFDIVDISPNTPNIPATVETVPDFDDLWLDYSKGKPDSYANHIQNFLTAAAKHSNSTVDDIKDKAAGQWNEFVKSFEKWAKKQEKAAAQPAPVPEPSPAPQEAGPQTNGPVQSITDDQIDQIEELCKAKDMPLADALAAEGLPPQLIELDFNSAAMLIEKLAAL